MSSKQTDPLPSTNEAPLVLIVEDELPIAEALRYIVEDKGYQTITARDGLEGLDLARNRHPDLIITDLMMPRLDGMAFIRAVREDAVSAGRPAPPIILTSAIDDKPALDGSAPDAFVPKPFDLDSLELLLDGYLSAPDK